MKTTLHEVIDLLENGEELTYQTIAPFKKSVYTYFKDWFCYEPVCMVTFVTNVLQGVKIVSSNDFMEEVRHYVKGLHLDSEEEESNEIELINFNSRMLKDLL